jgi:hypothetical protein
MFNPKDNLLEQQLAVSGLEMHLDAIFNFLGARESNKANKDAYEDAVEYQEDVAKQINQYNDFAEQNEVTNFMQNRDFSFERALEENAYRDMLQDFQFLNASKEYEKSLALGSAQLGLNAEAAASGIAAEQDVINEAFIQAQFQHTNNKSALNEVLAEQRLNQQAVNLNKVDLDLAEMSNMTARQELGLERMDKLADRKSLAVQMAGTEFDLESIGLEKIGTQYDLQQLGLDEADIGLQQAALNLDLSSLDVDRKKLDLDRLSRQTDRQGLQVRLQGIKSQQKFGQEIIQNNLDELARNNATVKTSALVQGLIAQGAVETGQAGKSQAKARQSTAADLQRSLMALDNEMSGKYKQAAMQMAEINADASLARQEVALDQQRIAIEEAGIDLQGQKIDIAAGKIGLQGSRLNLQRQGIGIQRGRVGLAQGQLDIKAGRVGLDQAQLAIQGERIGIQEAGIDVRERDLDIALAGIGVDRERASLSEAEIQAAIERGQYDYTYNEAVISANLESAINQSQRNIEQINLEREVADLNTISEIMIKPEQLPYAPDPVMPPLPIFTERMDVMPGYTPPPQYTNPFLAGARGLFSDIKSAATLGLFG